MYTWMDGFVFLITPIFKHPWFYRRRKHSTTGYIFTFISLLSPVSPIRVSNRHRYIIPTWIINQMITFHQKYNSDLHWMVTHLAHVLPLFPLLRGFSQCVTDQRVWRGERGPWAPAVSCRAWTFASQRKKKTWVARGMAINGQDIPIRYEEPNHREGYEGSCSNSSVWIVLVARGEHIGMHLNFTSTYRLSTTPNIVLDVACCA